MSDATVTDMEFIAFDRLRLPSPVRPGTVLRLGLLALAVLLGSYFIDEAWFARRTVLREVRPQIAETRVGRAVDTPRPRPAPPGFGALLDPGYSLGAPPTVFAQGTPPDVHRLVEPPAAPPQTVAALAPPVPPARPNAVPPIEAAAPGPAQVAALTQDDPQPAMMVPLPAERPAAFTPAPPRAADFAPPPPRRSIRRSATPAAVAAAPDRRDFLQRFFGMLAPSGPALSYAAPEDGMIGRGVPMAPGASYPHDRQTAIYDISAHTVTLPSGEVLEAHSGLGTYIDDPRHVDQRNRGATPPQVYELTPRETLFHGVQALRLNPVGGGGVYGRTGLLAHSYMLGPNGDSNGCVSFRDYRSFLAAFQRGEFRRLAVVARAI